MVKDVKYSREFCEQSIISEGDIRGMATLQNGVQIYILTPQTTWFCETAILKVEIKISSKWHQKLTRTASLHCAPFISQVNMWIKTSLPMFGFIAQLVEQRTGNVEVTGSNPTEALIFQASSFQLLELENLLRWSFFTFKNNIGTIFI